MKPFATEREGSKGDDLREVGGYHHDHKKE